MNSPAIVCYSRAPTGCLDDTACVSRGRCERAPSTLAEWRAEAARVAPNVLRTLREAVATVCADPLSNSDLLLFAADVVSEIADDGKAYGSALTEELARLADLPRALAPHRASPSAGVADITGSTLGVTHERE